MIVSLISMPLPHRWRNPKWWSEAAVWFIHHLYRLLSGYGERVGRALMALLVVLVLFASTYCFVGFERKPSSQPATAPAGQISNESPDAPLNLSRAMAYSLGVALLQKPEPKSYTTTALALVYLETILAPLQAALLALAIRRRFMK